MQLKLETIEDDNSTFIRDLLSSYLIGVYFK
jgi:hypothetical protein